jgi:uncharacterized protein (TIGR00251 family)
MHRWDGDDLVLSCYIQPKSSRDEIVGEHDQSVKIRITAPPVDGKANKHLIAFLAKQFGVNKQSVVLEAGDTGRRKTLRIKKPVKFPEPLNLERT